METLKNGDWAYCTNSKGDKYQPFQYLDATKPAKGYKKTGRNF